MLFLGSTKFPEESAYKKFLAAHGGRSNASTSMEATTYHFEVLQPHLAGALDIFAQFFIAPLFTESATDRELKAVDAEDARNRTNDSRRVLQVLKAAADVASPWKKFSTGNSETLQGGGAATRAALLDFHGRHYYGGRMTLALLGAAPLDELEELVRASFATVATHSRFLAGNEAEGHAAAAAAAGPPVVALSGASVPSPYDSASLPRLIHVAPLRELRELTVLFPSPPVRAHYRVDPSRLCSHLLGHEAEGSALAALQDRGWATALSAGLRVDDRQFCVFQVKVILSAEGEARWREVVGVVEEHCACVRAMSDEETARHWEEITELAALDFEFMEKSSPQGWATSHARRLRLFAPEHALSAGHLFHATLDLEITRAWVANLNINNALVLMACQEPPLCLRADITVQACDPLAPPWAALADAPHSQTPGCCVPGSETHTESELYYGVPFTSSPLPPVPASATPAGLQLPSPNSFIPRDRSLRAGAVLVGLEVRPPPPTLITADARGELWHALDKRYALPRVELRLHLAARPLTRAERTLASLHAALITQLLKRRTYDADVAGLSSSLSLGARGASLRVSGFSQHAPRLLATVAEALLEGAADAPMAATCFEVVRERMERRLRSRLVESPASQAVHWQELLLGAGERVGIDAEIADVRAATLDSLRSFHADWRRALFAATLAIGNITAAEARGCHQELLALLARYGSAPLPPKLRATSARGRLPSGAQLELHSAVGSEAEKNSCAHVFLQAGVLEEDAQACLRVLASVIKEPCFRELRTKQQVGYSVSASHDISLVHIDGGEAPLRVEGLVVCATSKSLGAAEVLVRIDEFLAAFRAGALASLDESTVRLSQPHHFPTASCTVVQLWTPPLLPCYHGVRHAHRIPTGARPRRGPGDAPARATQASGSGERRVVGTDSRPAARLPRAVAARDRAPSREAVRRARYVRWHRDSPAQLTRLRHRAPSAPSHGRSGRRAAAAGAVDGCDHRADGTREPSSLGAQRRLREGEGVVGTRRRGRGARGSGRRRRGEAAPWSAATAVTCLWAFGARVDVATAIVPHGG